MRCLIELVRSMAFLISFRSLYPGKDNALFSRTAPSKPPGGHRGGTRSRPGMRPSKGVLAAQPRNFFELASVAAHHKPVTIVMRAFGSRISQENRVLLCVISNTV